MRGGGPDPAAAASCRRAPSPAPARCCSPPCAWDGLACGGCGDCCGCPGRAFPGARCAPPRVAGAAGRPLGGGVGVMATGAALSSPSPTANDANAISAGSESYGSPAKSRLPKARNAPTMAPVWVSFANVPSSVRCTSLSGRPSPAPARSMSSARSVLTTSRTKERISTPSSRAAESSVSPVPRSFVTIARASSVVRLSTTRPRPRCTASISSVTPSYATSWSRRFTASRNEPVACRATASSPPGATVMPSPAATTARRSTTACRLMRRKSKRWQRETMVAGMRCASVVASTKMMCGGGSSSVLSSALKAASVSMCTSSMR